MVKGKEPGTETSEDSVTATAGPGANLVSSRTSIGDSGKAATPTIYRTANSCQQSVDVSREMVSRFPLFTKNLTIHGPIHVVGVADMVLCHH